MLQEVQIDLLRLDANPPNLDLVVEPTENVQRPVWPVPTFIAGQIDEYPTRPLEMDS